jgi:hypothetical protein
VFYSYLNQNDKDFHYQNRQQTYHFHIAYQACLIQESSEQ